jgi:hypothetical protein
VCGGNGGGELYAFDLNERQPWPVLRIDGVDPGSSVEEVAGDFDKFMELLAATDAVN